MIYSAWATTYVVGVLSAFLVSRCQRGRECRDLRVVYVVFRVSVCLLLSRLNYLLLSRLNLGCFTSYGVRHMHSIYPSELVLYCAIFMLCYAYYRALVSKI